MPRLPDPRLERDVYSVSRLNREVRILLEQGIPQVWIEAELSNFARPSSGHWYFSLKDRDAQLRCAMFRQRNMSVRFAPKDGAQVLVRGRVGLYEPRGEYQLIVEHMEEAGLGALRREFERLKDKLAAEGLFATEAKRPLPAVPRRIGVVTSPTGAAIRDILHILARRFPAADVLIYPTQVQGAAAVPEILAAIGRACEVQAGGVPACDVLIVARGGGSLEDLWAFNDERIARAIRACPMPVVTGIGHEVDFTIADFVADVRAPTPSGAAQLVVPDARTWLTGLAQLAQRFGAAMGRQLRAERLRLDTQQHRLTRADPRIRLQQAAQRLDELEQRLAAPLQLRLARSGQRVQAIASRLATASPAQRLARLVLREAGLAQRLREALLRRLALAAGQLDVARRTLHAVSPLATLARGFAIVTRAADGALLRDARQVAAGDEIVARLGAGGLRARVLASDPPSGDGILDDRK